MSALGNRMGRCGIIVTLLALVLVPAARADLGECLLAVEACDESGCVAFCALYATDFIYYHQGGVDYFQLAHDVDILAPDQTVMGTLYATEPQSGAQTRLEYHGDPQVNLNFAMTAGLTDTSFTLTSTHMTFPTIYNAAGKAEVGINVTDRNGTGAMLSRLSSFAGVSQSYYNGLPPTPGLFADILPGPITAGAWGSGAGSDTTGVAFLPIVDPVSSISAQINFMLSARDLASGSSTFIVLPEPAAGLLALLGLALLRRRS